MNSYTNTHTYTHREDKRGKKRERERKVSVKKKKFPTKRNFHPQSHLAISANVYCCPSESQGVPLTSSGQRTEPLQNVLYTTGDRPRETGTSPTQAVVLRPRVYLFY